MNVCYFGADTTLTRNKILIKGLRQNDVCVDECILPKFNKYHIPINYVRLLKWYISRIQDPDIIYLSFSGVYQMPLIKMISKLAGVPVVFDSFISLYDTYVHDRKLITDGSFKAKGLFFADKYSCKMANISITDTCEHIKYFCNQFGLDELTFRRVFIGADDSFFEPRDIPSPKFNVKFYGTFIPVHGVETILKAANMLKQENEIRFEVLGMGQTYDQMLRLKNKLSLNNVVFRDPVSYDRLSNFLEDADLCLGIFGRSCKAARAIPTKYYECIAMRKPVITSETPAMKEYAVNYKHVLFCKRADEKSLAEKILELKDDSVLRRKIARNGYSKYKNTATPRVLGRVLKNVFVELI